MYNLDYRRSFLSQVMAQDLDLGDQTVMLVAWDLGLDGSFRLQGLESVGMGF